MTYRRLRVYEEVIVDVAQMRRGLACIFGSVTESEMIREFPVGYGGKE
jgi:hypothetical protein